MTLPPDPAMGRLKVTVAHAGGIAPVVVTIEADTDALEQGDADVLRRLVVEAGLFEPSAGHGGQPQPDRGGYRITISDESGTRSAVLDEAGASEQARALVDFVRSTRGATKRVEPLGG